MSTTNQISKVMVVGASGTLGTIIVQGLLQLSSFKVTVLARSSSTASFPTQVSVVRANYNSESEVVKAFEGQDAIISTVGAAAFLDQKVLIDAAIKAKVQRFIPSEFSSNTQSAAVRDLVPVFEAKLEVMRYLEEKEATGLSWTGLSVGPLFDWGLKSGFLGFDIAGKKARVWDEGSVVFSATNQDDVARALIAILQKPQETANRFLYVETVAASQAEILKSLETATGHSWLVERVKTSDLVAAGRKQVAVGDFTGNFPLVQASVWGDWDGLRSNYSVDEALSNTLLGLAHGRLDSLIGSILASLGEN